MDPTHPSARMGIKFEWTLLRPFDQLRTGRLSTSPFDKHFDEFSRGLRTGRLSGDLRAGSQTPPGGELYPGPTVGATFFGARNGS